MTYFSGFVVPVPKDRKQDYRKVAEDAAALFRAFRAQEIFEGWEAHVSDGTVTDCRRAVQAEEGEAIVSSWIVWSDRKTAEAAVARMMADDRMPQDTPFDMQRMIFGGFSPLFDVGRTGESR